MAAKRGAVLTDDEEKRLRDCESRYTQAHSAYVQSYNPSEGIIKRLKETGDELTKMYKDLGVSGEEQIA